MTRDNGARGRCGAKTRAGGECQRYAMANGRCALHGGKTPKGVASPNYKHGRYSKYGPKALRDASLQFLQDPELLSLQANIAMCDARIADALTRLDEGGGLEALGTLARLRAQYREAKNDVDAQVALLKEMFDVIDNARGTERLFDELDKLTEQRRRLVDTEVKRQTGDLTSITIERAFGFVDVVLDIVARQVQDRDVLRAIVDEIVTYRGPIEQQRPLPLPAKTS